jgi:transposase-like protein
MNCNYCKSDNVSTTTMLHSSASIQWIHNLFRHYHCNSCGHTWKVSKLSAKGLLVTLVLGILVAAVLVLLSKFGWFPGAK